MFSLKLNSWHFHGLIKILQPNAQLWPHILTGKVKKSVGMLKLWPRWTVYWNCFMIKYLPRLSLVLGATAALMSFSACVYTLTDVKSVRRINFEVAWLLLLFCCNNLNICFLFFKWDRFVGGYTWSSEADQQCWAIRSALSFGCHWKIYSMTLIYS